MTRPDGDTESDQSLLESSRPTQLTGEAELDAFVEESNIALVEFYTNGCGLCQSMEPVVGNVGRELGISVGLVNPRDDPPLVDRFSVTRVPLLVVFVDGELVARRDDGFVSGDELTDWIQSEIDQH